MQEGRQLTRWQIKRNIKIKLDNTAPSVYEGVLKDLNLKGMQVVLDARLPYQRLFKMQLSLSDDIILNVDAWIIWHRLIDGENTYGVYFTKISDQDKEKIYQFLRADFPQQVDRKWWKDNVSNNADDQFSHDKIPQDQRVFARFPADFTVKFLSPDFNQEGEAKTQDISAKGLRILSNTLIPINSALELWIHASARQEPVYARGMVSWSKMINNDFHSGINLEKADFMNLARLLRP
ncbi:MAG: PilZ domain-containing protein [Candidatus Omnitrophica bacterium]|jgi:hypothetical protein|nr:PilZ domain-containing protein [Candidatus Omnitrophota bacterium]